MCVCVSVGGGGGGGEMEWTVLLNVGAYSNRRNVFSAVAWQIRPDLGDGVAEVHAAVPGVDCARLALKVLEHVAAVPDDTDAGPVLKDAHDVVQPLARAVERQLVILAHIHDEKGV